ncbi:MAG: HAD family hydrolase [Actinomycetota bacterium]|nr:HAD family hydrolase [Actinomycetota bacterium]
MFDFYGTLARATTWGPAFEEVFERRGLTLTPEAHDLWRAEVFDGQEHHEHSKTREHYLAWELARLGRLAAAADAPGHDTDDLVGDLHRASRAFELEAYPEVPGVLAELTSRHVKTAVCSNWGWDLEEALDQAGLGDQFEVAVTSAQVGTRKPHPSIFIETLARMGTEPPDALFVGDTWYPDVEGARSVGLRAVHVWRADAPPGDGPPALVEGVERVADLSGILALL